MASGLKRGENKMPNTSGNVLNAKIFRKTCLERGVLGDYWTWEIITAEGHKYTSDHNFLYSEEAALNLERALRSFGIGRKKNGQLEYAFLKHRREK